MIRRVTRLQLAIDGVLAFALLVFVGLPSIALAADGLDIAPLEVPFAIVSALVLAAIVMVRRLAPLPSLVAGLVLGIAFVALGLQVLTPMWFALLAPLYAVGRYGSAWQRVVGGGIVVIGAAAVAVWFVRSTWAGIASVAQFVAVGVAFALLFGSALIVGLLVAVIVDANRLARERREEVERAAVEQERAGIARDMHDVVAHSLAVVIAQANGARYASETAQKDESLLHIATTASSALGDVRSLLQRLRHEQAPDPEASITQLGTLVEHVRAAGLRVELTELGPPVVLPRASDIAGYRIVQEALTNALRHGDRTHPVIVTVTRGPSLEIIVRNGMGKAAGEPGHGLVGMRERARIAGGSCTTEIAGSAFVVRALLPVLQGGPA